MSPDMKTRQTKRKERVSFRMCESLWKRVEEVATKHERPKTWVIEKCLKEMLPKMEETRPNFKQPDLPLDGFEIAA